MPSRKLLARRCAYHFDPSSGDADPEWSGRCARACYDCLLSYRNQGVHRLLDRFEQYAGRCQICGQTFCTRNGEPYFEGLYLGSTTKARWIDSPGNVLCLCAGSCAKMQFVAMEADDIIGQVPACMPREHRGSSRRGVKIKLCGQQVELRLSDRHLLELNVLIESQSNVDG